ncbi:glycosyltransferase family 2 protein [Lactococcus termiticola]|uniref:Glycosyl transferase n=1 Tax=Lactococcus termiticola TaxID=2169526 RepID=A0A2R5HEP2_9LACT|nr:glycosyltransferase family 2 protein [Lactococcus termiticola]GBG96547.1 glycosyl transferase [Lactococcus termiticola]
MANKLLTITIPSYNTAAYIDECLPYLIDEAIIDEVELLIVSDGSKDDTVAVASRWAEKYPNSIRVIDKENGGHGSTINRGIQEATGKYFKVVDGDDWVKTDNLVRLVNFLRNNDVDLINNPYFEHDEQTREETLMMALNVPTGQIKVYPQIVENIKIPPMHTVTYRTAILKEHNIRIDEKMFYVDVEYITYPLPFVESQVYLDFPVYVYRVNSGTQSMAVGNMVKNRQMHYTMLQHQWDFIKKLPANTHASVKKVLLQRFSELILAQYVINLSIPQKEERKAETAEFTAWLKAEQVEQEADILALSKRLIKTGGRSIAPAVKFRNMMQNNQLWRGVERGLLNTVKRMKK